MSHPNRLFAGATDMNKLATYALVILGGSVLLTILASRGIDTPTAPLTAAEQRNITVSTAIQACKNWTTTHSKLAVDEFSDEYEVTGRKLATDHYLVGLEYRTRGIGLLAHSQCEYRHRDNHVTLVTAKAWLVQ